MWLTRSAGHMRDEGAISATEEGIFGAEHAQERLLPPTEGLPRGAVRRDRRVIRRYRHQRREGPRPGLKSLGWEGRIVSGSDFG
jgi:hypothetical protein